ncbi:hypothetical protein [Akkermansia glycaniphila]|uniref:hypothetical protein n=1 Tax=Akkermansia glycaniphila TaxID=1679444 RepID=UPI0011476CF0|nr:hypothetical protein [Akkermansia glycaniphila]
MVTSKIRSRCINPACNGIPEIVGINDFAIACKICGITTYKTATDEEGAWQNWEDMISQFPQYARVRTGDYIGCKNNGLSYNMIVDEIIFSGRTYTTTGESFHKSCLASYLGITNWDAGSPKEKI